MSAAGEGTAPEARWAVVLGASSGTGAAIAETVARRRRWNVFGAHRGNWPEGAAAVQAAVEGAGARCEMWVQDAGTAAAAEAGAERLVEVAGPGSVGLLVHSLASTAVGRLAIDQPVAPRQIEASFDRMAHSFVYWTRALHARGLLAPGAQILGLSNLMTEALVRNTAVISATKAALEMYVRHLAMELGPEGYRVNLLKFGLVVTEAARCTFPDETFDRLVEVMTRASHTRQLLDLQGVADFVDHLAGPEARWFNGATIDFTGGEPLTFFDALMHPDD
jgi:NAD(P)-dependent dehydrogenase (short-subunit alcohol dehydrogenase family)